MPKVEISDSQIIDVTLDEPADIQAFLLFGIHKCGSTLMNKVFMDICRHTNIPYVAISKAAFQEGIPASVWGKCESLNSILMDGYCYGGFRSLSPFMRGNDFVNQRKKILLVRDPRDAIVSAYFSFSKSHRKPGGGAALKKFLEMREKIQELDIESYAIEHSAQVKRAFNNYHKHFGQDPLLKVYRYEDIIFNKESWITDMLDFLDISLEAEQVTAIAKKHDIVPGAENSDQHIRKVKPGDHREKLTSETIDKLNNSLSDILERYGYEM